MAENGAGQITEVDLSGTPATVSALSTGLDVPTTFAVDSDAGQLWVVESQFDELFGDPSGPGQSPFCVVPVALD